jgi:hypothetical protein
MPGSKSQFCPQTLADSVKGFLQDPYTAQPVTLALLDDALGGVNRCLAHQRQDDNGSNFGIDPGEVTRTAAAAAGVAGGGALPATLDLAVGVTDFMVERAKDEVAFGFVLNLRNNVRDDRFIRAVLPRSHDLMQRIDTETFQSFMPLLRSSFVEDLNDVPTRSDSIAIMLNLSDDNERYLQGVAIAYARGVEIRRGAPPAIALSNLIDVTEQQMANDETRRALRIVGLLAREYGAGGAEPVVQEFTRRDRGWVRRYFVAFIAHDLTSLEVFPSAALATRWRQDLASRETDAVLLLNQIHAVRNALRGDDVGKGEDGGTAAGDGKDPGNADRVTAAAGAVLEVLRTAPRFAYLPGGAKPASVGEFEAFVADATLLHQAITRRDYGSMVTWLLQSPHVRLCTHSSRERCETRLKYLSFASSLAAARSAEEVTTALRTASAPVGSFRAKRSQTGEWAAPRSVSLIGYLGASRYQTEAAGTGRESDSHVGVGLPVGVEASLGMPWGGLSLFLPVVDLGPLANESLGLADDGETGELEVDQVLAPGVGIVVNLFRSFPLSFGLGVQSVRRERETDDGSRKVNVARSFFFVGVDATLFHFRL